MKRNVIEIERTKMVRTTEKVEVELPTETCYYFITGERKAYKVVPHFKDWEGGDGTVWEYKIVQVGLSFECTVEQWVVRVSAIPNLLEKDENSNARSRRIVKRMVNNPERGVRTKEQFEKDLQRAIDKFKED